MRWVLLLTVCGAWLARAQMPEAEFTMPAFGPPDAGTADEPEPPPVSPPPMPVAPLESPPVPAPEVSRGPAKDPRWSRATLSAAGLLSGWRDLYAGVEVSLAAVFPLSGPRLVVGPQREVEGWLLTVGGDVLGGRISGPLCAGSDFCGDRWAFGASARVGHASGFAAHDGSVGLRRFWFGGLTAQAGYVSVPPAPLVAGSRWFEGVFRLKGGVEASTSGPLTRSPRAAVMLVQAFVFAELIVFAPVPRGFHLGAALGVGF
ncbi:MAG: hypothetical protein SFW67_20340 [Myxococcaceae bacterium]|nr:hypothetical protein [Myxococcaceae bacterium]